MSISLSWIEIEGIATTIFHSQGNSSADGVSAAFVGARANAAGTSLADAVGVTVLLFNANGSCTVAAVGFSEENDIINIWLHPFEDTETWTDATNESELWIPAQADAETWTDAIGHQR